MQVETEGPLRLSDVGPRQVIDHVCSFVWKSEMHRFGVFQSTIRQTGTNNPSSTAKYTCNHYESPAKEKY